MMMIENGEALCVSWDDRLATGGTPKLYQNVNHEQETLDAHK